MKRADVIRFLILRTLGNFFLLFALTGIILTFGQALLQETIYRYNAIRGVHYSIAEESTKQKEKETSGFKQTEASVIPITPVDTDFGIVIPKINADARILPNIDPGNYEQYMQALKVGVAHAQGSVFPGQNGSMYLFAHSTDYFWNVGRYNAVFYLLKEVEIGDEIDIFFGGRRFIYKVSDKKIVSPDDVSYLDRTIGGEQKLTLQTCWPPGTTIKRLLVFAKPKSI